MQPFGSGQVVVHAQAEIGLVVIQQGHIVLAGIAGQQLVADACALRQDAEQLDADARPVAVFVQVGVGVAVGVGGHCPDLALFVDAVQVGLFFCCQRKLRAAAGAGVLIMQGALPGRLLPLQGDEGVVQQHQGMGVPLANSHVKRCLIEGFQHPFVGGGAVGIADGRRDLALAQGLSQLVIGIIKHRFIGEIMVGGKVDKALVAAVAIAREADHHAVVGIVLSGFDAAVACTHGQHRGHGANGTGGKIKDLFALGRFAQHGNHVDLAAGQQGNGIVGVAVVTEILIGNITIPRNFLQKVIAVAAVAAVGVDHIKAVVGVVAHPQRLGGTIGQHGHTEGGGKDQPAQQQQCRRQRQEPVQKAVMFCSFHCGNTPDKKPPPAAHAVAAQTRERDFVVCRGIGVPVTGG